MLGIVRFYGGGGTRLCLLSSFLLFKIRYVRYLMALRWIFFMRDLMVDFGMFSCASLVMECSCMAPLTPAMMVMRGFVCQPRFCIVLISGSYFSCLCARACGVCACTIKEPFWDCLFWWCVVLVARIG